MGNRSGGFSGGNSYTGVCGREGPRAGKSGDMGRAGGERASLQVGASDLEAVPGGGVHSNRERGGAEARVRGTRDTRSPPDTTAQTTSRRCGLCSPGQDLSELSPRDTRHLVCPALFVGPCPMPTPLPRVLQGPERPWCSVTRLCKPTSRSPSSPEALSFGAQPHARRRTGIRDSFVAKAI